MRWLLTVVGRVPDGRADVLVDADPAATVNQLWTALTDLLHPGGHAGPLSVDGVALAPATTLARAPLHDGAVVGLGDLGAGLAPEPSGLVEIRVVGGPDAGGVFRLPAGPATIGSDPAADVVVDDPSLPGAAVSLEVTAHGGVTVAPPPGLVVWLRGERLGEPRGWPHGAQLAVGWTVLERASPSRPDAVVRDAEDGGHREYNRPPRWRPSSTPAHFRLPAAPPAPERRPFPWLMAIAPLVLAGVLAAVLGNALFLGFALLSPLLVVGNHLTERRHGGRSHRRRLEEHRERVAALEADARAALAAEEAARRWDAPDPAVVLLTAAGPRSRLWERRREDPDFLRLRVGTGDLFSGVVLDDPARAEHRRSWTWIAVDVPVLVPLRERGVLGVAGPDDLPRAAARWLLAQAATLHSPRDLAVHVLTDPAARSRWAWVRWLPHARESAAVALAADTETVADRALELASLVSARKRVLRDTPNAVLADPDVLVVLDGAARLRRVPGVVGLLADGPAVGVYAICLDADERMLPAECAAVVAAGPGGGLLVRQGDDDPVANVRPELVTPGWSERVARGMAPLRDTSGAEEAALPDAVRLLDLLSLEPPTGEGVAARWAAGGRSTAALLGVSLDGPLALDLRRDGPHALIAGTTGAGKSELLQSLVATLAAANRPDAMMFVLVDYKGGSAFADCAQLPHTGGMVTDLDAHLVERALTSLTAELRRRERMLADAGAPDLEAYLRVAGSRPGRPALPRLLIVIDEFASLVRELPDFVTGLVDLARRGRSLGIHLVLATQRPGGVVSPEIRANTDLRIALRVTDAAESTDVIDSSDAVRIGKDRPGRAFVRTGTGLTRFQTARVGGRRRGARARGGPGRPWVALLPPGRLGHPMPRPPGRGPDEEDATDLAVLVEAIRKAGEIAGVSPQPSPWLPPLPAAVTVDDLPAPPPGASRAPGALGPLTFALDDLPAEQRQRPAVVDLATFGHLYVVGAPRTGRSQVLRTIGGIIGRSCSAADVHLYGIDCGNGALLPLAELPHCGAVVRASPAERASRLIARLVGELQRRVDLLGEEGFASVVEQRAATPPERRLPHLVVLLDRWERFTVALGEVDAGQLADDVGRILREGASAGLHLVVAGDRSLLTGRMSTLTEAKLVFRLPERADFSLVGVNPRTVPDAMAPGRALWAESGTETQVALLDPDASGQGQGAALRRIAEQAHERDADLPAARRPFRVDVLPARLGFDRSFSMRGATVADGGSMWALVGVGGDTLRAHGPDLAVGVPGFVVAGPPASGRSTVLVTMARSLLRDGVGVVAVAPRRSPLREVEGAVVLTGADLTPDELAAALERAGGRAAVLVDDAETLRDCAAGAALAALLRAGSGSGRAVVIAGDVDGVCAGFSGWQVELKKARRGLLLAPRAVTDGDLVGARPPRSATGRPVAVGRALLHLGDGDLLTVQVPHAGE